MLRFEGHYLFRTDDRQPIFLAFGLGTQFGFTLNSSFDAEEIRITSINDGFGIFESSSEKSEFNSGSRSAFTSYTFIPADINARLGEQLYLSFELRYGLKYLRFTEGPSALFPVLGLGFGVRYIL